MASSIFLSFVILLFLHFHLTPAQAVVAGGELIYEDGYTVSTVLDGDKSNIKVNPQSILHQSPPSDLFILLDSVASTFYTVSLPTTTSNDTVIERLAGNGEAGYEDGDLASAKFNKPKSFAVDFSGNVYVADHRNHAIRKITKSGVTTIAGGYSQKPGHTDGPALDATFSDTFELTFIPQTCALMISDHVLGGASAWLLGLGLGLSCLLSLIIGFVIRPYVIPYEGVKPHHCRWTWTHCLMSVERQVMMLCSGIRSAVVKSTVYSLSRQIILLSLSHLSLMFRPMPVKSRAPFEKSVSLLDIDEVCASSSDSSMFISPQVSDQLKDLLSFDGRLMLPANNSEIVEEEKERKSTDVSSGDHPTIDGMIQANLVNFEEQAHPRVSSAGSLECSLGLVKRR